MSHTCQEKDSPHLSSWCYYCHYLRCCGVGVWPHAQVLCPSQRPSPGSPRLVHGRRGSFMAVEVLSLKAPGPPSQRGLSLRWSLLRMCKAQSGNRGSLISEIKASQYLQGMKGYSELGAKLLHCLHNCISFQQQMPVCAAFGR